MEKNTNHTTERKVYWQVGKPSTAKSYTPSVRIPEKTCYIVHGIRLAHQSSHFDRPLCNSHFSILYKILNNKCQQPIGRGKQHSPDCVQSYFLKHKRKNQMQVIWNYPFLVGLLTTGLTARRQLVERKRLELVPSLPLTRLTRVRQN